VTARACADTAENSSNIFVLGAAEWDAPVAIDRRYVTPEPAAIAQVNFVELLGLRGNQQVREISGWPAE
jgi:hypothetical protein